MQTQFPGLPAARKPLRTWLRMQQREPEKLWAYLFVAPAVLLVLLFRFYPMLTGIGYSFTNWDGINPPQFIGLANFQELFFKDLLFRTSLINLFKILLTLPLWIFLPLVLALLIHQGVPGWRFFRAAFFFPTVLSAAIIAAIFTMVLRIDGAVNLFLGLVGIEGPDWLGTTQTSLPALIAVALWGQFGVGVVVYLAGLATVEQDLFDAAKVDGANWGQTLWYVTVPSIQPTVEFYTVTTIRNLLAGLFAFVFVLTAGGPGASSTLPEYIIWLNMGSENRLGYASAISTILFVVFLLIVLVQVRLMGLRQGGDK